MLERYIKIIFDIHRDIQNVMEAPYFDHYIGSKKASLESAARSLEMMRERLDFVERSLTDPLWVVLLGRFSAGKSSLINAFFQNCGCAEALRNTGLTPTDKQATIIAHENSKTGLLNGESGVIIVDGLAVLLQPHKVERLAPLLLVDTPGLLDEQETDDKLMEFVGHADVVLHCMTPDAQLVTADRKLLEKRRRYFPSQIYQIIITKGDLHYRDDAGHYSDEEWRKNLALLEARYAGFTHENLDLRNEARTRKVSVIDSKTGMNIDKVLSEILALALDKTDGVPRVRDPIVRNRLGYICTRAIDTVIKPVGTCVTHSIIDIDTAKGQLATNSHQFITKSLDLMRKVLQLKIKNLSAVLPQGMESKYAQILGVERFTGPSETNPLMGPTVLNMLYTNLRANIAVWANRSDEAIPVFSAINDRRRLLEGDYSVSRKNMRFNTLPYFEAWFGTATSGQRLKVLLKFDSLAALPLEPNMVPVSEHGGDGKSLSFEEQEKLFQDESVRAHVRAYFSEGLGIVASSAGIGSGNNAVGELKNNICKELSNVIRKTKENIDYIGTQEQKLKEQTQSIRDVIALENASQVSDTIGAIRDRCSGTADLIRGNLYERGISLTLDGDLKDTSWQDDEDQLKCKLAESVERRFNVPICAQLEILRSSTVAILNDFIRDLEELESRINEWIIPNQGDLDRNKTRLEDEVGNWTSPFVNALSVFRGIKSCPNFYQVKTVGENFTAKLSDKLNTLYTEMVAKKRFRLVQALGCSVFMLILISGLYCIDNNIIRIDSRAITVVGGTLLACLGVAFTGVVDALFRLCSFKKQQRQNLAMIIDAQMDEICKHSEANLEEEERAMNRAYDTVASTRFELMTRLYRDGVQSLIDQLMRQLQDKLAALEEQYGSIANRVRRQIDAFLKNFSRECRECLDQTAEASAKCLQSSGAEIINAKTTMMTGKLDDIRNLAEEMRGKLESIRANMFTRLDNIQIEVRE